MICIVDLVVEYIISGMKAKMSNECVAVHIRYRCMNVSDKIHT